MQSCIDNAFVGICPCFGNVIKKVVEIVASPNWSRQIFMDLRQDIESSLMTWQTRVLTRA